MMRVRDQTRKAQARPTRSFGARAPPVPLGATGEPGASGPKPNRNNLHGAEPLGYRLVSRSIVSMHLVTFVLRVSTAVTGGLLLFLVAELTRGNGSGPGVQALLSGGFYTTELTGAIVFRVLADRYGRKVIMLLG